MPDPRRSRRAATVALEALGEDHPYIRAVVDDRRAAAFDASVLYLLTARRAPGSGEATDRDIETEREIEAEAEEIARVILNAVRSLDLPEEAERRALATAAAELRHLDERRARR